MPPRGCSTECPGPSLEPVPPSGEPLTVVGVVGQELGPEARVGVGLVRMQAHCDPAALAGDHKLGPLPAKPATRVGWTTGRQLTLGLGQPPRAPAVGQPPHPAGPSPRRSLLPVDLHVVLGARAQGHSGLQQVEDFEEHLDIPVVGHLQGETPLISAASFPVSQTQGHQRQLWGRGSGRGARLPCHSSPAHMGNTPNRAAAVGAVSGRTSGLGGEGHCHAAKEGWKALPTHRRKEKEMDP